MERKATIREAKNIMGKNFIGPEELLKISSIFNFFLPKKAVPTISIPIKEIKKIKKDYILILGIPGLTINKMRQIFGFSPEKSEPCFYNQDWYLKEKFADQKTMDFKWYLIQKTVDKKTKGKNPLELEKNQLPGKKFPSAVLAAFTFFAYYFLNNKEILWSYDFIWCNDKDLNGDRVYAGRYKDRKKINKNGFNIHRHLSLRQCHGVSWQIKI